MRSYSQPRSRSRHASSTYKPCSTVLISASMTVMRAFGYSSKIISLAVVADCMEPLNFVVIQIQIIGTSCFASGRKT